MKKTHTKEGEAPLALKRWGGKIPPRTVNKQASQRRQEWRHPASKEDKESL
jgi:hypothetical protein